MTTKRITIDLEAYQRLKRAKRNNESFSEVIKRQIRPPVDPSAWIKKLQSMPMDPAAESAVERQIAGRGTRGSR